MTKTIRLVTARDLGAAVRDLLGGVGPDVVSDEEARDAMYARGVVGFGDVDHDTLSAIVDDLLATM